MEYALIKAAKVENVIVADPEFVALIRPNWDHIEALDTVQEQGLGVGIGWGWDGAAFLAPQQPERPPLPRPTVYTKTQFRELLTDAENTLLDNFNVAEFQAEVLAIRSLTVMERASVRSAIARFKDGEDVDRTNPVTVRFITALGALGLLDGPRRAETILSGEAP